jgi:hypothetical protein
MPFVSLTRLRIRACDIFRSFSFKRSAPLGKPNLQRTACPCSCCAKLIAPSGPERCGRTHQR